MLVITLLDRSHSITEDKDAGKRPLSANKQQRREKRKNPDGFVVGLDYFMLSSQCGLFLENASVDYSFHTAPSVNWFSHQSLWVISSQSVWVISYQSMLVISR